MNIFKDQIENKTYDEIANFCKEGNREGWQLDYKKELPKDGLQKYFAAFSNTRGGVVLLGVEEDRKTGVPVKWEGIDNIAKSIEKIHQWAAMVDPKPDYEVYASQEKSGKAFVVIRINEGIMTPYYVQNDPRVYVRTGNITPSIDIASPDMLELLVGKKQKAESLRQMRLDYVNEVFKASLKKGEVERTNLVAEERRKYKSERDRLTSEGKEFYPYKSEYYSERLGTEACMCKIILQPFYPQKVLMSPSDIKKRASEIRDADPNFQIDYPSLNHDSIQDGVVSFEWGKTDGDIKFESINSFGLFSLFMDVLRVDRKSGSKLIYLSHPLYYLFHLLKGASNFYKIVGYNGGLVGSFSIDNLDGVDLDATLIDRWFPPDTMPSLMPKYEIAIELSTQTLFDNVTLQNFFIEKAKELFWAVGYGDLSSDVVKSMLKSRRWLIEENKEDA